jgi:hypothetical protein
MKYLKHLRPKDGHHSNAEHSELIDSVYLKQFDVWINAWTLENRFRNTTFDKLQATYTCKIIPLVYPPQGPQQFCMGFF